MGPGSSHGARRLCSTESRTDTPRPRTQGVLHPDRQVAGVRDGAGPAGVRYRSGSKTSVQISGAVAGLGCASTM